MHNFGHFGLDSNLSLGPFSTWCKLPLGSEYASDVNLQLNSVDTCNPNPNVRKRKCPKSVHGGTLFCVAHGGGKRCAIPGCTKSARGRTDFCVRHGGGKRCKSDGCGKSAQGSTDFCKAHGGGKRCLWAPPCDRFARGKSGLCAAHDALMREDRCIDGGGGKTGEPDKHEEERESVTPVDEEEESFTWSGLGLMDSAHTEGPPASSVPVVPEGRVHGGSLMTMLLSELHQC